MALRNATQNIKCNPRPVCVRVCVCASQASLLCASDKRRKEPPRCSVCPSVCVCVAECFVPKNYGECACAISIENRITLPRSGILHKRPFKLVLVCVCMCVLQVGEGVLCICIVQHSFARRVAPSARTSRQPPGEGSTSLAALSKPPPSHCYPVWATKATLHRGPSWFVFVRIVQLPQLSGGVVCQGGFVCGGGDRLFV